MESDRCSICLSDFPLNSIAFYNHKDKKCKCALKCCDVCNDAISQSFTCLVCRAGSNVILHQLNDQINNLIFNIGDWMITNILFYPISGIVLYCMFSVVVTFCFVIPKIFFECSKPDRNWDKYFAPLLIVHNIFLIYLITNQILISNN